MCAWELLSLLIHWFADVITVSLVWGGTNNSSSIAPSRKKKKKKSPLKDDSQWIILGNGIKSTRIFRDLIIFMINALILKINKIIPTLREFCGYREYVIQAMKLSYYLNKDI